MDEKDKERRFMTHFIEDEEPELDKYGEEKIGQFILQLNPDCVHIDEHAIKINLANLSFDHLRQLFILICNLSGLNHIELLE